MYKISILACAFLIKTLSDTQTRSERILTCGFRFLFGNYIRSCVGSYLLYKRNVKINTEINLAIKKLKIKQETKTKMHQQMLIYQKSLKQRITNGTSTI